MQQLGLTVAPSDTEIHNSDQFVLARTRDALGEAELIKHPLDLVESGIAAGIETLRDRGLTEAAHICLIGVPRRSLSVTFACIYEVVRRCGWSVLPLGGSSDGRDIVDLCNTFHVDTLILAADTIEAVFAPDLAGRFPGVERLLHVSGVPSREAVEVLSTGFPRLEVAPFLYISELTGPIGMPSPGRGGEVFDGLNHVLVEVETIQGDIKLTGSGDALVTVLGLEKSSMVRRRVGDQRVLTTSEDGRQALELRMPRPRCARASRSAP